MFPCHIFRLQELQQTQQALELAEDEARRQHHRAQRELSDVAAAEQAVRAQLEEVRRSEAAACATAETRSRELSDALSDSERLRQLLAAAMQDSQEAEEERARQTQVHQLRLPTHDLLSESRSE